LSFTAQLLPFTVGFWRPFIFRARGITSAQELLNIYTRRYAKDLRPALPARNLPDISGVERTNFCDIGVRLDAASGRAVVVSVIDNLVRALRGRPCRT